MREIDKSFINTEDVSGANSETNIQLCKSNREFPLKDLGVSFGYLKCGTGETSLMCTYLNWEERKSENKP